MIETICTLKDISEISHFAELGVKSLCVHTETFATYSPGNMTIETITKAVKITHENNMRLYVRVDAIFYEKDLIQLEKHIKYLIDCDVDGIYFADMAVYQLTDKYNRKDLLIYDPQTLITNDQDLVNYLDLGIKRCVVAKELTFDKTLAVTKDNGKQSEMIVFGYLRMSLSRRKMLSGYQDDFKTINLHQNEKIRAKEESRKEKFYIYEDQHGTYTYSPYIFYCMTELLKLTEVIKVIRFERCFIEDEMYFDIVKAYLAVLNSTNIAEIDKMIKSKYSNYEFSTGFLYEATTL